MANPEALSAQILLYNIGNGVLKHRIVKQQIFAIKSY